jgi:hypothetical protein
VCEQLERRWVITTIIVTLIDEKASRAKSKSSVTNSDCLGGFGILSWGQMDDSMFEFLIE